MVVQQELDHLLVASAGAVKQGSPAPGVIHLQVSTLLQADKTTNNFRHSNHYGVELV